MRKFILMIMAGAALMLAAPQLSSAAPVEPDAGIAAVVDNASADEMVGWRHGHWHHRHWHHRHWRWHHRHWHHHHGWRWHHRHWRWHHWHYRHWHHRHWW